MTPEDFKRRMQECADTNGPNGDGSGYIDPQDSHKDADNLMVECLRSLGYGEGCDIFDAMSKWYA